MGLGRGVEGAAHGFIATPYYLLVAALSVVVFVLFHVGKRIMAKRPPKPSDRPSAPRFKKRKDRGHPAEPTLRDLILQRPTDAERQASWDETQKHGPRATAIVASAFTEDALRYALYTKFIPQLVESDVKRLIDQRGPMGSFYASIELGYALGLYGSLLRDDLHTIRTIRNAFAHAMKPLTFDTPLIAKEVARFRYLEAAIEKHKSEKTPEDAPASRRWRDVIIRSSSGANTNMSAYFFTCEIANVDLVASNPVNYLARALRMEPPLP